MTHHYWGSSDHLGSSHCWGSSQTQTKRLNPVKKVHRKPLGQSLSLLQPRWLATRLVDAMIPNTEISKGYYKSKRY